MNPSCLRSIAPVPWFLAVPMYLPREEIVVGRTVFHNFLHEEFMQEGADDAEILIEDDEALPGVFIDENLALAHNEMLGNPHQNINILHVGGSLRELANEFAQSRQRQTIREISDRIDLSSISRESFWQVLEDVFLHGFSGYNLVALFYFCSDVLIKCAKTGLKQLGFSLFRWAVEYIVEKVCKWVHEHGGWENAGKIALGNRTVKYVAFGIMAATVSWLVIRGFRS